MTLDPRLTGILSDLGPFFALDEPDDRWQPLSQLVSDVDVIGARIVATRQALADARGVRTDVIEPRVAASAVHLGLAARLVSPALAAAVLTGDVLDLEHAYWRPVQSGTQPLAVTAVRTHGAEPLADALGHALVGSALRPLTETVAAAETVSDQVLRGNLASALAGAATMIASVNPGSGADARGLVEALVRSDYLAGTGAYADNAFRRNSCCLFYRLPGGGLCGDCVLDTAT